MHLAWLYLLHARFARDEVGFRDRKDNGRFERFDGENDGLRWPAGEARHRAIPTSPEEWREGCPEGAGK
jgi:hypothetical protein